MPTSAPAPPAAPGGRRARRKAELRERILRAALDIIARQGFFATTVEQITEAADVGKGTFFNYFPSKEHALAGFGQRGFDARQLHIAKATQHVLLAGEVVEEGSLGHVGGFGDLLDSGGKEALAGEKVKSGAQDALA